MFRSLIRRFIPNAEDTASPAVRTAYGQFCGVVGILLNCLLSAAKISTGLLTGAISILSDGVNNLSDAASSLITLLGFRLAGKRPDREHPYGHGRMEYFAGMGVCCVILVVALRLFRESLDKILSGTASSPGTGTLAWLTFGILLFSIFVKLWMALFCRYAGKKIASSALSATSKDSLFDCVSTAVVLLSAALSFAIPDFPIDGCAGIIVSLFIAYTGISSLKEIAGPLLGTAPDPELVRRVSAYVLGFDPRVCGVHDLAFHDYGPGRKILVLHVEVPATGNIMELHDMIDNIEHGLARNFSCTATIHMDPVITESPRLTELRDKCRQIVKEIDPAFDLHDFRMNEGPTHANLIFDVMVPRECKRSLADVSAAVAERIHAADPHLSAAVTAEYSLV